MAADTCCSKSRDEQLYQLELLVDRLNLTTEKIQEIGSNPLTVILEFLDFPIFEIKEEDFWSPTKREEKQTSLLSERKKRDGSLDFSAGKSYFFTRKPSELVEAMRSHPLKIEVHRSREKRPCESDIRETPVCQSEVPLSGCLCDQVAMAMNDPRHLPKPYTMENTWNLIDDQGKPSGTILLRLRLSCLGKSVVTQFAVRDKAFLFKSSDSPNEFRCSRLPVGEDTDGGAGDPPNYVCMPEGFVEPEVDPPPKPQSVIGLVSVCKELSKRDGGALQIVPPIKLTTHRTVEEKPSERNDFFKSISRNQNCNFHSAGYFMKNTDNPPCGTGNCRGGLCTGTREYPILPKIRHGDSATRPSRTGSCCSGHAVNYCYQPRMRGGGRWDVDHHSDFQRLNRDGISNQTVGALVSGSCSSPQRNERNPGKPGCGCSGKSGIGMMGMKSAALTKNGAACLNNPCLGVDCLIRAFKETQEFVDSIGKVPGLAGLGLMDPSESPFFGRERNQSPTSCGPEIGTTAMPLVAPTSGLHPATLRNTAKGHDLMMLHAPAAGLAAETQPQVTGRSKKKSEERSDNKQKEPQEPGQLPVEGESGPCAEPRCKSRKKKPQEEKSDDGSMTNLQVAAKKIAVENKLRAPRIGRPKIRGKSKSASIPGPGGDRPSGQRSSYIRVSKRIMRLVNALRDPRFYHGHKNCHDVRIRVPGNMGWLWNSEDVPGRLKTPIGWKPGAISKFVWDRLQEAKALTAETTSTSESRPTTPGKGKRGRSLKVKSFHSLGRGQWARNRMLDKDDEEVELPPTLHIHRKDGTYYVTMYPIKAEHSDNPQLQEAVKPLQFKITKNRDDLSGASSSTASDMEIEFSPPAAVNRYTKKVPVVDKFTQVSQQEILEATKVPATKRQSKSKKGKKKK